MSIASWFTASALALAASCAQAAPIQHTWDFTATFAESGVGTVHGSITATLDLDNFVSGTIDAIDLTLNGHTYSASEVGYLNNAGWLFFGGKFADETVIVSGHNDFYLYWMNPSRPESTVFDFEFTSASADPIFVAQSLTVTERAPAADVPEPGSVALFGTGLACAALLRRRARRPR